jgi:serralysin
MLLSRTIAGTLLAGLLWMAGPVSAGDVPTADEQYMLELINRMRLNPDGEVYRLSNMTWGDTGSPQPPDLNEGLPPDTISSVPCPPLAFNAALVQSASNYSETLLANNAFEHDYGNTTPQSRMQAAGYVFSGSWGLAENLALTYASYPLPINSAMVESQYDGLFIDGNVAGRGHRVNLLNGAMKEAGIGIANTPPPPIPHPAAAARGMPSSPRKILPTRRDLSAATPF